MPIRTIFKFVGIALLFIPMIVNAGETSNYAHVPISREQVADAMVTAGLTADGTQVELLSMVSAKIASPSLQVVSISRTTAGTVGVRLRCRQNGVCLPFYVLVHSKTSAASPRLKADGEVPAGSPQGIAKAASEIHGGERATLILENADLRISLPVICMQSGSHGQRIRVTSKDGLRFFEGEVIGAGMLKGSL
jgi:hypothetical protein